MPLSVRLKRDLERLLDETSRRQRKTRSALIHDALTAFLKQQRPRAAEAIRRALERSPGGFEIEREQPAEAERRSWKR